MCDPIEHLVLCAKFENECEDSWHYEEVNAIFKESYSEAYKVLPNRIELIKSIAIGGMIQEHYKALEMATKYQRAKDIAKTMALTWMEVELEDEIHNRLYAKS